MSVQALLLGLVAPMEDHLAKLDGDTGGADAAGAAFGRARGVIETVQGDHRTAANALLGGWWGERAGAYTDRLGTLNGALDGLATTAATAQQVAAEAVGLITQAGTRIDVLIQGFIDEAGPIVQAALVAQQGGAPGVVPRRHRPAAGARLGLRRAVRGRAGAGARRTRRPGRAPERPGGHARRGGGTPR